MNRKNFCMGMGMGLVVGYTVSMLSHGKKSCMKGSLGKTLKTVADIADSVYEALSW